MTRKKQAKKAPSKRAKPKRNATQGRVGDDGKATGLGRVKERAALASQRRRMVVEGILNGKSYARIGEELGISKQAVSIHFKKAMALEAARTDRMLRGHKEKLRLRSERQVEVFAPLRDQGDTEAAKVIDRQNEFQAKLLGLHSPTKTEVTGKDGGAIQIESWSDVLARARDKDAAK